MQLRVLKCNTGGLMPNIKLLVIDKAGDELEINHVNYWRNTDGERVLLLVPEGSHLQERHRNSIRIMEV